MSTEQMASGSQAVQQNDAGQSLGTVIKSAAEPVTQAPQQPVITAEMVAALYVDDPAKQQQAMQRVRKLLTEEMYPANDRTAGAVVDSLIKAIDEYPVRSLAFVEKFVKHVVCPLFLGRPNTDIAERNEFETIMFKKFHLFIRRIISMYSLAEDTLYRTIESLYPYHVTENHHSYICYLYNFLLLIVYMPKKKRVVETLFEKLLLLDLSCNTNRAQQFFSSETIQSMNQEDKEDNKLVSSLIERAFLEVLSWIDSFVRPKGELSSAKCNELFALFYEGFERIVLPSDGCSHIHFIMFFLCSLDDSLPDQFVDRLWDAVSSEEGSPAVRERAPLYLASYIARSQRFDCEDTVDFIEQAVNWCHEYADEQDRKCISVDAAAGGSVPRIDFPRHAVFYRVFQAVLYLIVSRSNEMRPSSYQNLSLMRFQKLMSCKLNPLAACGEELVSKFADLGRHYQFALCSAIIERNKRAARPGDYVDEGPFLNLPFDTLDDTSEMFERVQESYRKDLIQFAAAKPRTRRPRKGTRISVRSADEIEMFNFSPKDAMTFLNQSLLTDLSTTEDEEMVLSLPKF